MSPILPRLFFTHITKYQKSTFALTLGLLGLTASIELQADEIDKSLFFKSRFSLDQQGKADLSSLRSCREATPFIEKQSLQLPFVKENKGSEKRYISYLSAPEISENQTHLIGNVSVSDSRSIIKAEEVIFQDDKKLLKATGGVTIEYEKAYFSADSLTKNENNDTELVNASFFLFSNNANGIAEKITVNSKSQTQLTDLTFSTCPVGKDSWQLSTSEMEIDESSGRGEAWNTTLRVNGIPVFYFPYINFPTDERRKSGLLSPSIKNGDDNGLDISQPVYWNIAPSMDATFSFRQIEKRGTQLGSELRWLTQNTVSNFRFEWLGKDKLVEQLLSNNLTSTNAIDSNFPTTSAERWQSQLEYQAMFNDFWSLNVDTNRVSDSNYFKDFGSGLENSNATQLTSQLNLGFQNEIWQLNLFSRTYQSLIAKESYRYLPAININADFLSESGFRWQLDSEWNRFEHKDINFVEASRTNIKPSLSYPMTAAWGYVDPKLSFQSTRYVQQSQINGDKTSISRNIPIFSLDTGVDFDRKTLRSEKRYTETISPRIFYAYIPFEEQDSVALFDTTLANFDFNQLWQENRFTSIDRIGDTNHISLAVANRLVLDASGEQLYQLHLGRKYYLDDRQVQLNQTFTDHSTSSPWLAELSFKINQHTDFESFIEWDQQSSETNQSRARIKFEPLANHIVNVSHRYRKLVANNFVSGGVNRQVSEEADVSFAWPINDRWRLLGRWYNDLHRKQTIETLFGVEYESCCWAIRLVAQKYLNIGLDNTGTPNTAFADQYNQGFQLQFVFKGLGSAGNSGLSDLLESSIAGYQDPFLN